MNEDERLGPYRLLRRIGEDGLGVLHLGLDPQGQHVAVRVLSAKAAEDDLARDRLSREVEILRRVRGEHVAEVVDADIAAGRLYIVSRHVPGNSLEEIIARDGPLGLPALLNLARGMAAGLVAMHSAELIHRALNPRNVLMVDGAPVLTDLGIATVVATTGLSQGAMLIFLQAGYPAPEIIEGHEAGPEIDVHAWAWTLLFAATGLPPFGTGSLEAIFQRILEDTPHNVDAAPEALQPLIRAAIQRDPAKRPSAKRILRDVQGDHADDHEAGSLPLPGRSPE